MADKDVKPEAVIPPVSKPKWLQEVEADAVRITQKRMRDAEEEKKYNEQKAKEAK